LLERLRTEKEGDMVPPDFEAKQLDPLVVRAREQVPDLLAVLTDDREEAEFARELSGSKVPGTDLAPT